MYETSLADRLASMRDCGMHRGGSECRISDRLSQVMAEFSDSFILICFIHTGHSDVCNVFAGGYTVARLLCFHHVADLFVLSTAPRCPNCSQMKFEID